MDLKRLDGGFGSSNRKNRKNLRVISTYKELYAFASRKSVQLFCNTELNRLLRFDQKCKVNFNARHR